MPSNCVCAVNAPTILKTIPKMTKHASDGRQFNMGKRLQQKEDVVARLLLLPSLSSLELERRCEFFISCSLPMKYSKDKGASGHNHTSPNEAMIVTGFPVGTNGLKWIGAGL